MRNPSAHLLYFGVNQPVPLRPPPPDRALFGAVISDDDPAANQNPERGGGGPVYPFAAREKLVHNEQTKLTATAANNVGVAFIAVGMVTPIVTFVQNPTLVTEIAPAS